MSIDDHTQVQETVRRRHVERLSRDPEWVAVAALARGATPDAAVEEMRDHVRRELAQ